MQASAERDHEPSYLYFHQAAPAALASLLLQAAEQEATMRYRTLLTSVSLAAILAATGCNNEPAGAPDRAATETAERTARSGGRSAVDEAEDHGRTP